MSGNYLLIKLSGGAFQGSVDFGMRRPERRVESPVSHLFTANRLSQRIRGLTAKYLIAPVGHKYLQNGR